MSEQGNDPLPMEEGDPPLPGGEISKPDAITSKKAAAAKGSSGRDYKYSFKPDPKGAKVDLYPQAKAAFESAEKSFKDGDYGAAKDSWDQVPGVIAEIDKRFDAAETARDAISAKQKDAGLKYDHQHKPGGSKKAIPKYPNAVDRFNQGIKKLVLADFEGATAEWEAAAEIIKQVDAAMKQAEAARDKVSTKQADKEKRHDFMHKPEGQKNKVHKYPEAHVEFNLGTDMATEQQWDQALYHWQKADELISGGGTAPPPADDMPAATGTEAGKQLTDYPGGESFDPPPNFDDGGNDFAPPAFNDGGEDGENFAPPGVNTGVGGRR